MVLYSLQLVVQFKDVEQITKERTVKVIPNAIQFQTKGKGKAFTFTSFTQRDKTFKQVYKLWQNALTEKVRAKTVSLGGRRLLEVGLNFSAHTDNSCVCKEVNTSFLYTINIFDVL